MHLCLISILIKQTVLCVLSHLLCCISITFVPAFTVFVYMRNAFFTGVNSRVKYVLTFADLVARISGFHPGYPGSVLGRELLIITNSFYLPA